MEKKKRVEKPMSVIEAADLLDVSIVTIRTWCLEGLIKYYKLPGETGAYRINRKSFREFRRKLLAGKI